MPDEAGKPRESAGIPALLTVREVAAYLKVQEATVRNWIRDGDIRAIKFGRAWRVREDDLMKFVEHRRQ